ncbi:DeoR/GlpR family DNA-binding transcription regulator [Tepidibacillus infernus]|uniref:DeoR family transcriptional regulator n=1 Tax=Tepidibacillus decaturensis TaxID=1413211 RepID=A0A135L261_9BACI|nr:DeoR/GlpR family DNA-binding transcription regulator [Tepidibacillus decaturensis]KXG43104.1 DeoR family transcriptional regulator [Tepidibacillus decaturensis]
MFSEERKTKILEYVQKYARASVPELAELFQVSESTVRRDLKELEDEKLIKRTHGGAIPIEGVNFEPTFQEKEDRYSKEKEMIAKKATDFIEEGDTILLDSGTTIYYLVKELKRFNRLTVVTNSLVFAQELQDIKGIEVIIIGGSLRKETLALVGPFAEQSLSMIKVDKAFIATNGIDLKEGITTPNLLEAATKRRMIQSAKQVILLTDHSKIGKVAFAKVADLQEIDKYVIDDGISESVVKQLNDLGVDLYLVSS